MQILIQFLQGFVMLVFYLIYQVLVFHNQLLRVWHSLSGLIVSILLNLLQQSVHYRQMLLSHCLCSKLNFGEILPLFFMGLDYFKLLNLQTDLISFFILLGLDQLFLQVLELNDLLWVSDFRGKLLFSLLNELFYLLNLPLIQFFY